MRSFKKIKVALVIVLSVIIGIVSIPVSGATSYQPFRTTPQVVVINGAVIGLKADGTVLVASSSSRILSELQPMTQWKDIVQISSSYVTIGLKKNGTVIGIGTNERGVLDFEDWTDIVQVDTDELLTVGLKSDGSAVATGDNSQGQCDEINSWTDITQIHTRNSRAIGLKKDGTVVYTSNFDSYAFQIDSNIETWTDITQVAISFEYAVGLKKDGTLVTTSTYVQTSYECESAFTKIADWTDINSIAINASI